MGTKNCWLQRMRLGERVRNGEVQYLCRKMNISGLGLELKEHPKIQLLQRQPQMAEMVARIAVATVLIVLVSQAVSTKVVYLTCINSHRITCDRLACGHPLAGCRLASKYMAILETRTAVGIQKERSSCSERLRRTNKCFESVDMLFLNGLDTSTVC